MHVDEEKLERLLSGELSAREEEVLRDHLRRCRSCARYLELARRSDDEIGRLLMALDHPVPGVQAAQLMQRARRRKLRPRLVAAGIALLLVAGGASAMPGSPLRSWLSRVLSGAGMPGTTQVEAERMDTAGRLPAGVSVVPGERFELVFEAIQETGRIRVVLSDQAEVAVRSDGQNVGYLVEPHGVRVLNAGSTASFEVTIPRDVRVVIIRVREVIVLRKQGEAVVAAAAEEADGVYVVDFGTAARP